MGGNLKHKIGEKKTMAKNTKSNVLKLTEEKKTGDTWSIF